jgi:hypothetical protein
MDGVWGYSTAKSTGFIALQQRFWSNSKEKAPVVSFEFL